MATTAADGNLKPYLRKNGVKREHIGKNGYHNHKEVCLSACQRNVFMKIICFIYSSGKNFNTIYCVLKITQEVCFYFELFFAKQDKYDVGMFCKCSPTLKKKYHTTTKVRQHPQLQQHNCVVTTVMCHTSFIMCQCLVYNRFKL